MIKFPSINQFRNTVKTIKMHTAYIGKDNNNKPIYDYNKTLPCLDFIGTIKLHGTNASIVHRLNQPLSCQSRNKTLFLDEDNAGFAHFILNDTGKSIWNPYFVTLRKDMDIHPSETIIAYGEWCGRGIQNGVAVSQIEKTFVLFAIKVYNESTLEKRWLYPDQINSVPLPEHNRIKSIYHFPTYQITIDFKDPALAQNELVRITKEVEKECPVGAALGISGSGEGVVWRCMDPDPRYNSSDYWFKVKGEKHSVSKVKTLAPIDVELMNSVHEFVDMVLQPSRLEQGIEYLQESGLRPSRYTTAEYLRWIIKDVLKEESDTMEASGLQAKQISRRLSSEARKWYFAWLDQNLFQNVTF